MKKFLLQAFAVAFCWVAVCLWHLATMIIIRWITRQLMEKQLMWWLPQLVKQVIW